MKQNSREHLTSTIQHLTAFSEYLIIKGFTRQTKESVVKQVVRFLEWAAQENREPQSMIYTDMLAYVNHCKKRGNKQRTLQITIGNIKHYYDFLMAEKLIEDNPCTNVNIQNVKRKTLHETFTPQELEHIYKTYTSDNHLTEKRNRVIIGLLIYQGIRTEELEKLTPQDVRPREGKLFIAGSRRTNERELKLEAHQLYDLMDYVSETRKLLMLIRGKESDKLFVSMGKSEKFSNSMFKLIQQLKAQNPRLKDAKQLRASVITNWLKQYNTRKVQVMAGHRYISSTEAYKANNMDQLKEDINKYHPIA